MHGKKGAELDTIQRDEQKLVSSVKEVMGFIFSEINRKAPLAVVYIPDLEYLPHGEVIHKPKSVQFEGFIADVAKLQGIHFESALKYMAQGYKNGLHPPVGFSNSNILGGHLNELGHESVKSAIMKVVANDCRPPLKLSTALQP